MQMKENIKASRHWPLCGEFTGTSEFPAQTASNAENVSIWWRHHDYHFTCSAWIPFGDRGNKPVADLQILTRWGLLTHLCINELVIICSLGPWMNHLPPVWWFTFRFRFFNCQLVWKLYMAGRDFLFISSFYSCFIHYPRFTYYFSCQINLLWNDFFTLNTLHWHFP